MTNAFYEEEPSTDLPAEESATVPDAMEESTVAVEEDTLAFKESLPADEERLPVDAEESLEAEETVPVPVQIQFPEDYLDTATYRKGVEELIDEMELLVSPAEPEEEPLADLPAAYVASDPELPYDTVFFTVDGRLLIFPSSYADDVSVLDNQLVNLGASYTAGVVLPSAPVSNYIVSEITFPTYHSSTWYQYLNTYGQPYRVVDRYRSSTNTYSSYTRPSVSLSFAGGNDWAGFGMDKVLLLVVVVILIVREVLKWIMS